MIPRADLYLYRTLLVAFPVVTDEKAAYAFFRIENLHRYDFELSIGVFKWFCNMSISPRYFVSQEGAGIAPVLYHTRQISVRHRQPHQT